MPEVVRITDVSPRDGLQNEPGVIATADKVRLVQALCASGVDEVEVTSFVSPRWVPQLADCAEVCARVGAWVGAWVRDTGGKVPVLSALVPNEKGLDGVFKAHDALGFALLSKVSVFTAASETFSRKNTNATIAETLERFGPVVARAHGAGLRVRGYVSCVIACPFEGAIAPKDVARVARALVELGVDEVDLGDTIGAGTPETTRAMLREVHTVLGGASWSAERMTLHLHDTFGRAGACVAVALAEGVRSFDGAAGGLGGCPYASTPGRRAPGNISTEELVHAVRGAGFATHVDASRMGEAAALARGMTGPRGN